MKKAYVIFCFSRILCSLLFLVALEPSKVSAEGRSRTQIDGPRQLPNVELRLKRLDA
jgi:hypothetical protein